MVEQVIEWWKNASREEREKFLETTRSEQITGDLWYVYTTGEKDVD